MSKSIRLRPALLTAAAGIALAGSLAMTTAAGAASHSSATRHAAWQHGGVKPRQSSFSDWPMFRADRGHSGVSSETAIGTANAAKLTAGWTAALGTSSYSSPAVATSSTLGKAVVFAGANSKFFAYPASGSLTPLWTFKLGKGGGAADTSPAVFNGVVYFASTVGNVYALNADTGALICSYATGQLIQASPVVVPASDGSGPVVYTGTDPAGAGGGQEVAIYGAGNTHGACTKDWEFTSWVVTPGGTWSAPAFGADANGTPLLVFGSVDNDDSVYALNANTGALVWRFNTSSTALFDVGAAPTISAPGVNGFADGVVYVTGKDHITYAIDLTTGTRIWKTKLAVGTNGDVSSSALAGSTLYLGSDKGVYALNATTGAVIWNVLPQFTFYGSPAIVGPAGQQVLVIGNNEGRVYALNVATGATVWSQRPTTKGFWASPAVSQGTIYVIGLDGVLRTFAPA
jgi:outer membrane protein assembly factor BamB